MCSSDLVIAVPVATVPVGPVAASVTVGQSLQLSATLRDDSANLLSGRTVTWSSSNDTVATVSGTGLVTARNAGSATIRATSEGKSGVAGVTAIPASGGGASVGFVGMAGPGYGPADPAIAAGPDRLLVISNFGVVIYSKSGAEIARKSLASFFQSVMAPGESEQGDVAAIYDERSGRFFLDEAAKVRQQRCVAGTCVGHYQIAVSKTSTPS